MTKAKSKSGHKYGPKASHDVERAMHEMKHGTLKSGGSGKKVTNPKQAVAIGLSEARREGAKVPRRAARTSSKPAKKSSKTTRRRATKR